MTNSVTRRQLAAIAGMLAWALFMAPASAQTAGDEPPPDQVDPPAPGEGEPLEDPSDPPPPEYSAQSQPSPYISLSGPTWGSPDVRRYRASQRYASARRASQVGWPNRARSVVLVSGKSHAMAVAASSLSGAVDGPLLLTTPRRLSGAAENEIQRLRPRRVFVVGDTSPRVRRQVRRLGTNVRRVEEDNRFQTAMAVARLAVDRGARRHTVVVVSGSRWADTLGVSALAAGKQFPVLLARRSSGATQLERRVDKIGARRVLVVGRQNMVSHRAVRKLSNVQRLAGGTASGTAAVTARRARAMGLNSRPTVVAATHWADSVSWGAMAGGRRGGVVIASAGPGLARPTAAWLSDVRPGKLAIVRGTRKVSPLTECQLASGYFRSWRCAEKTLQRQGYHVPAADGRVDRFSIWAIYAFEKVARLGANGSFGNTEWNHMLRNPRHAVRRKDLPSTHVEIDIGRQLILLVENGKVRHQIHTSTGAPSTPTVRGTFSIYEKRPYYQTHNKMYWPVFFHGGYAFHGYPSIPLYPASHGCARTYNGNMDLIYRKTYIGERVATY